MKLKWWLPVGIVMADQLVKYTWREVGAGVVINKGVALGVLPFEGWWLIVMGVLAYLWLSRDGWGWSLVIGGGLSNLVDRLVMGGVVDKWSWGWPRFNLADVAIIAGSLWLLVNSRK